MPQKRALFESIARKIASEHKPTEAEKKADLEELFRRAATCDQSVSVEECIRLSKEPASIEEP
jgi:hypothetical protein